MDTSILDKAIVFAVKAHQGAERKGKGFPYIVHPLEAVAIAATMTNDQELLAAAALHDTVEDAGVKYSDVKREFGERVAQLVETESDIVVNGKTEEESWQLRKSIAIDQLKAASRDAKIVALSDKLSNARAIYRDCREHGDEVWKLFHVKSKKQHYRGLVKAIAELEGTFAFEEFADTVDKIFKR